MTVLEQERTDGSEGPKLVGRYSEDITILDVPQGSSAGFLILVSGDNPFQFVSETTLEDLKSYAGSLRSSVPHPCRKGADYLASDPNDRAAHLETVAEAGRTMFELLVPEDKRADFVDIFMDRPSVTARAVGAAASIPWEALFLPTPTPVEPPGTQTEDDAAGGGPKLAASDGPSDSLATQGSGGKGQFLGADRLVIRSTGNYKGRKSRNAPKGRAFGLILDDCLGAVICGRSGGTLPAFGCSVDVLPPLTAGEKVATLVDFIAKASRPRQAYHLDCHLDPGVPPRLDNSQIRVSSNVALPFPDLNKAMELPGAPFVFLNFCHGGSMFLGSDRSYARSFVDKGAASAVASEAAVGDDFAAEFAETFYVAAAAGLTVGEALRATRRAFLQYDLNPSALFYTLYCSGDTILDLGGQSATDGATRALARLAANGGS